VRRVVRPLGAMALGVLGAVVAVGGVRLLERLRIDDPVGAIPVHLFAGVAGTVLLPAFAMPETIPPMLDGRLEWTGVQLLGAGVIALFAFLGAGAVLVLASPLVNFRVAPEDERIGLNIAEHGAGSAMVDLLHQLQQQGEQGAFSVPVEVERETDAGHVAYFYNQVRERFVQETERNRELLEEAAYLAHHDPLTGLKNRRAFMATADEVMAIAKRYGVKAALVVLDIDHFKAINDTYGHAAGDAVLRELAGRMTGVARASDTVARLGWEEFAVLLNQATLDDAMAATERMLNAIRRAPFEVTSGERLTVTASLGVADLSAHDDVDAALKAADDAMYAAKRGGRDRIEVARSPMVRPADIWSAG